jgi:carbon-monoxide dehydrogenase large subunit
VHYEPLAAVTDVGAGLDDGAPLVHDDFESNECYVWTLSAGEVDQLFAEADVTVSERYFQNRLIPNAMEPRGVLVQPVPAQGEFTVWSATQIPPSSARARDDRRRPRVEGASSRPTSVWLWLKLDVYAEEQLALALARKLGRPIKWIEDRSEGYLATIHGRDVIQEIELAATADGTITAVRTRLTAAMGAYLQLVTPGIPILGAWLYGGSYGVKAYDFTCTGVFTNTTPTDAYRGAGRPEATYAIERAVDALARKLEMDPVELRRKNFVTEFPATIASGLTVGSGRPRVARPRPGAVRLRRRRRSRRSAGSAATRSSSASASRPTSRCAGLRRRASWRLCATRPAAGTPPPCAACPRASCRC